MTLDTNLAFGPLAATARCTLATGTGTVLRIWVICVQALKTPLTVHPRPIFKAAPVRAGLVLRLCRLSRIWRLKNGFGFRISGRGFKVSWRRDPNPHQ